MPFLSAELGRLRVDIARLSEVRKTGSEEISNGGYTYYWSGTTYGARLRGVAAIISSDVYFSPWLSPSEPSEIQEAENCGFLVSEI